MRPYAVTALLVALLALLQVQLWFGRGSVPEVAEMTWQLQVQNEKNRLAQATNEQLAAEVGDLKEGLEMVEEKARKELGMIRPNEIFVQLGP